MTISNEYLDQTDIKSKQKEIHSMMYRISKITSSGDSCVEFIKKVMIEVVEELLLDGLYIFAEGRELDEFLQFYWNDEVFNEGIILKEEISTEILKWYEKKMQETLFVKIPNVSSALKKKEIEAFHNRNIQSLVMTPIYSEGQASGVICFTKKKPYDWCSNEINILHTLSIIINQSLSNEKAKEEIQREAEKIEYLSKYDKMTGLRNRCYAEVQLEMMDNPLNYPLTIVMGDLNGLRITNDAYGHESGNELLMRASAIIKREIMPHQIAARWGGDEFLIALEKTSEKEASILCNDIKKAFEISDSKLTHNSISLGFAVKYKTSEDIGQVIRRAEDHMYEKKLLESRSLRSSILKSMQQTLHEKSFETEAHASRLRHYSKLVGIELGLTSKALADLELVAMLHDIGKIAVSNEILEKAAPLNNEEWVSMKQHSESGYRILNSVPELSHISKYVLSHHERWDGKGYPKGLKEVEIPLLSRIIGVVDAFDAMTHNRAYRKAITEHEAKEELMRHSGSQFDPDIVSMFVKVTN